MADRLASAARRALESLEDFIQDTVDPGVAALGARWELRHALRQRDGLVTELRAEIAELRTKLAIAERQNADLDELCAAAEHANDRTFDPRAVPR